ncbi:MAG: acyltransferase [Thermoplasmata archaeon]|nr:acyltransferase [Thermoplasmata archaeon]MBE3140853.1 acyltransferase [Thermoplasmata archaeon]
MTKKRFTKWKQPTFDKNDTTKWNWMCQHHKNLKLGKRVDIGAFTYINAKKGVTLEDYVQIGSHCSLYSISTIDNKEGNITLKKNCRVGTHSVVMPDVTIGENAIIGAFSFVITDIPDNTVAYGVPAKAIRKLTKKEIEELYKVIK